MEKTKYAYDFEKETAEICQRLEFPEESTACFLDTEKKLKEKDAFGESLNKLVEQFCKTDISIHKIIPKVEKLAKKYKVHKYTLDFVFILHCAPFTREKYSEKNISDDMYWEGLKDLKYKLLECIDCEEVSGTFVADWYEGFLRIGRFTLGRFQFEPCGTYNDGDQYTFECGYTIKKGDKFIGFHIPSSGQPLTDDIRNESYKMAYDYFKEWSGSDVVILQCHSWLLYPENDKIMGENSNIVRFMRDFELVHVKKFKKFYDAWRVYGKNGYHRPKKWQEDTKLQRSYKKWVLDGNYIGNASGFIILHNGKNVTHIKDYFKSENENS